MDKEHIGLIVMIALLVIGISLFTDIKTSSAIVTGAFVITIIMYGNSVHEKEVKPNK